MVDFTIPVTGTYDITAAGAEGGGNIGYMIIGIAVAGLDPAIHAFERSNQRRDARVEPAHGD